MKIILTGSLGNISKPLATALIAQGHSVTIISRNAGRIENIGAVAAIGTVNDIDFLITTFKGAEIVYLMEPPIDFFDKITDTEKYGLGIARNYSEAIQKTGVTKVIHLSSIGGHTDQGVGMLATHHLVENILKELPDNVAIKTMRPVGFYHNMLAFTGAIKNAGKVFQN